MMNLAIKSLSILFISTLCLLIVSDVGSIETKQSKNSSKLSIKLKARTIVLGPDITLGEVSNILTPNSIVRTKLLAIKIGHARPPGESSEIKVSYIKRCLKVAGFEEYAKTISGPRAIRVVTAQVEIDKAILKEEFAKLFKNTARFACLEFEMENI